ncbi:aromatic alcohol reductase [Pseudomonas sp.]|uniref:aromatic alcohol reductase n=1 Tax=Pseudomonas sp. TaxID=306 RepID=UPI00261EC5ED|nr:aromatic alcohol reductase [Pseudomonas sp.]
MHVANGITTHAILVLGAGELGMSVLRQLSRLAAASGDTSLTVLLRPATIESKEPSKARDVAELRSLGIEVLAGDLVADSDADLRSVFKRFDTLVSCIGFAAGAGMQRKLACAAIDAGVKRYLPWQFGVDYDVIGRGSAQDLFDEQLDVRDLLRAQRGTQWVIVSTGMFTSFLFEPYFGVVDLAQNTVRALGSWNTSVTVTTPEDIGMLTAQILFTTPRINNQVVYTAGDTLTYGQLADTVDKVLGRKMHREEWSVPSLKADLEKNPLDPIKKYRVVFAEGKGVAWDQTHTFNHQRKIDLTTVEDWIRLNVE